MTTQGKWIVGIIAVILVVLGVLYATLLNKKATTPEGEPIVIGVIAGTTGEYASAGEGYVTGFNLALQEWNASKSPTFEAIVEDDGFDARKGVNAYSKLRNVDQVDAYAILSTFTIDAVMNEVLDERKPVALGFEQSEPAQDDNIFQVLPAARPIMVGLGRHIQEEEYEKPVALVSINSPVYASFAEGFAEGYGREVLEVKVTGDSTAIRTLIAKIKAEEPDAIAFFVAPRDGALITREILRQFQAERPQLVYEQSIQSGIAEYKEVLGDLISELDGSIVALSRNALEESFVGRYREAYGADPPFGADMGYNSFMLLANSYDSDVTKWIENMKNSQFIGADGEVSFDEAGLRIPNTYFAEFRDGTVVVE